MSEIKNDVYVSVGGKVGRVFQTKNGAELLDAGLPDPVIAHRLGEPLEMVRSVRRSLGLQPVRFDRRRWEHELARQPVRPAA